jgi:hypothetical protein
MSDNFNRVAAGLQPTAANHSQDRIHIRFLNQALGRAKARPHLIQMTRCSSSLGGLLPCRFLNPELASRAVAMPPLTGLHEKT